MKKRVWTLILALCLALSLMVGCQTQTTTTPKSDSKVVESSEVKKVELEFFSQKPEAVKAIDTIISKFMEEHPNIIVKQVSPPDARTVLTTRISTNEMPDMLNTFPAEEFYKTMMNDGLLTELTGQPFLKNVSEKILELSANNGKYFALPMTLSSYGIYYRTDIFQKQGLTPPTTYKELIDVCKKLKDTGIQPFSFADKDVGNIGQRLERLVGVINNDTDSEFKKVAADELKESPSLKLFADMLVELKQYGPMDSLGIDHPSSIAEVVNDKAAMLISGTWALGTMKTSNPDIKIELIPFPNPSGDKTNVPINIDTSFSIATSCKNQDAALKFIEFLSRTEIAQIYCDMEGTPNMVKGVQYNIPQHAHIKSFMDKGDIFLTAVNFWPTGLREDLRVPAQQLIIDADKDQFIQATTEFIKERYKD